MTDTSRGSVDWMLDDLVTETAARLAVVLSTDGMVIQWSTHLDRDHADSLSAAVCSLVALAQSVAHRFNQGPLELLQLDMAQGTLVAMAAGNNAVLAVMADRDADIGLIGYQMTRLVEQVNSHLATSQRTPAPRS